MRFWASTVFSPPEHYFALARAVEAAGFHGVLLADHLVTPEVLSSPYPYTANGKPGWPPDAPFLDVWVTVGALAAVTTTLQFGSAVYVAPARDVFTVAKQVGTAAVLSGNRVTLGVGAGWMEDEFDLTGQPFANRGERLDEMIDILTELWSHEWVEHHGKHYQFDRLQMTPRPTAKVPIWAGGYSRAAIRRATALCDGWVGVASSADDAVRIINQLRVGLRASDREDAEFEITMSLTEPVTANLVEVWAGFGVTGLIVRPWAGALRSDLGGLESAQAHTTLHRKIAAAEQFGTDVIAALT